ncbi:uncharacterized protein KY384_004274 [Bacidia gigantensis]|uniref:uncharacterized protein n=1 Tax=Bacidia gigantensis TaxID=2732470 RepID=UPI001D05BCC3|nr:uncharacterized protein KY384_004274 [Bacidia gigantensis]KAG8530917.1 hypothetical protein KY384_004274 [Bacidia gigantensis]
MDFIHAFIFGLGNSTNFLQDPHTAREWLDIYASRRPFRFWDGELPAIKNMSKRLGVPIVPAWVAKATSYIEDWTFQSCQKAKSWTKSISTDEEHERKTAAVVIDQLEMAVGSKIAQDPSLGPHHLQVASEVLDHLAAGHETSGITLTYLYWELSRNAALQDSLRNELLTLNPQIERVSSSPSRELPDSRIIDGLPLLHALLMETLRIHSAIPGPQPRKTPSPPISVAGSPPLTPGTRISAHAYSLHRNPRVFPNPEVWNPSRWLDCSEKEKAEMSRWFWAFGSGGRMCIGSNIAMQGLWTTLIAKNH